MAKSDAPSTTIKALLFWEKRPLYKGNNEQGSDEQGD